MTDPVIWRYVRGLKAQHAIRPVDPAVTVPTAICGYRPAFRDRWSTTPSDTLRLCPRCAGMLGLAKKPRGYRP